MVCLKAIDIIERVDLLQPNDYSPEQKLRWLSSLDGKILREVIETHEGNGGTPLPRYCSGQETLLVQAPYGEDLYLNYIQAMIAAENSETQRYNRRMTLFNAAYQAWTNYYNRTHRPKRSRSGGSASGREESAALAQQALEAVQALRRDVEEGRIGGTAGADGRDGVSPTAAVTEIEGGHRVTITDASGSRSFDVTDGAAGPQGSDYVLTAADKAEIVSAVLALYPAAEEVSF